MNAARCISQNEIIYYIGRGHLYYKPFLDSKNPHNGQP